jgi:predicted transcriptional regulator
VAYRLTGDPAHNAPLMDEAVADQVALAGRSNISRAISELVEVGLIKRYYAGYATNHQNRGGGRHAVYDSPIQRAPHSESSARSQHASLRRKRFRVSCLQRD